jgi:hypothetical protein
MQSAQQTILRCVALAFPLLGLAACGGESSSSEPAAAVGIDEQSAELSIALDVPQNLEDRRRIALTWQARGASTFVVRIEREAGAGFEPIDASIAGNTAQFTRGPGYKFDFPTARVHVRACDAAQRCVDSNAQPLLEVLMASLDRVVPGADLGRTFAFGSPMAISDDGNVLAGAIEISARPGEFAEGTVLVHRRDDSGRWTREARLDRFAFPGALQPVLALSGDGRTLVVGAEANGGMVGGVNPPEVGYTPPESTGAVYVYQHDAQQGWELQAYLKATAPIDGARFGWEMALSRSGDRLVVADQAKQLHVFTRSGATWSPAKALRLRGDGFPLQVSMAGDGRSFAVIGFRNVANASLYESDTFVYDACPCDDGWRVAAQLAPYAGDNLIRGGPFVSSGRILALSADGRTLAVGSQDDSDGSNASQGAIHVFGRGENGVWGRQAKLRTRSSAAFDGVGAHLGISGDGSTIVTKACGYAAFDTGLRRNHRADATLASPGDFPPAPFCSEELINPYGGAAYVFERGADALWSHVAAVIPAPGQVVPYDFGTLALSADGGTLAIGAVLQDESFEEGWRVVID